jgi:hypothetical protein
MFKRVGVVVVVAALMAGCATCGAQGAKVAHASSRAEYESAMVNLERAENYLRHTRFDLFEILANSQIEAAIEELERDGVRPRREIPVWKGHERENTDREKAQRQIRWAMCELDRARDLPGHAGMRDRVITHLNRARMMGRS